MNSEAFQIELDQIDISKSFDTVPAELIQLAKVAQQSGTQSATMKENITSKIFDAFKAAAAADISPLSLHVKTCEEHGFAHDRPFERVDTITGQVAESFDRIKGDVPPSSFKTIGVAARALDKAGVDITQFVDTYEGDNMKLVSGASKLRKAYKSFRDSEKDLNLEEAKRLIKKYSDEDIGFIVELLNLHLKGAK
jgi:hypothetical protein|tara:strand:+ start:148 stop:732 length:585 start_codon:yes stop_codon:yes gene_type:complete